MEQQAPEEYTHFDHIGLQHFDEVLEYLSATDKPSKSIVKLMSDLSTTEYQHSKGLKTVSANLSAFSRVRDNIVAAGFLLDMVLKLSELHKSFSSDITRAGGSIDEQRIHLKRTNEQQRQITDKLVSKASKAISSFYSAQDRSQGAQDNMARLKTRAADLHNSGEKESAIAGARRKASSSVVDASTADEQHKAAAEKAAATQTARNEAVALAMRAAASEDVSRLSAARALLASLGSGLGGMGSDIVGISEELYGRASALEPAADIQSFVAVGALQMPDLPSVVSYERCQPSVEVIPPPEASEPSEPSEHEKEAVTAPTQTAKVLYDSEGNAEELTVSRGQTVIVLSVEGEWSRCCTAEGAEGYIPSNYLETITYPYSVTALYSNDSPGEGELQFTAGERLEVMEASSAGWFMCSNLSGSSGYVPSEWVTRIEE